MDHVVGGKFKLGKKIGSGSFGELFLGESVLRLSGALNLTQLQEIFLVRKMLTLLLFFLQLLIRRPERKSPSNWYWIRSHLVVCLRSFCLADLGGTIL